MWAQEWGNIYDIVAPPGAGDIGYDLTDLLVKGYDRQDGQGGREFLQLARLRAAAETFWKRSQFVKPADREVVCHASAWDIDNVDDLRIKMCTKVNGDDFTTIHHELGHNYYQRAYNKQPSSTSTAPTTASTRRSAIPSRLSITPEYLVQIGLLDTRPGAQRRQGHRPAAAQAMDKVAFLPFGLLIDRWRWQVFSGEVKPANYNKAWTDCA
jgi:peptidyl-dipeptidase A